MMYPLDIVTPDPITKKPRPFIIFIAKDVNVDINFQRGWDAIKTIKSARGGFILPMPNTGLLDEQTFDWATINGVGGNLAAKGVQKINDGFSGISGGLIDNAAERMGITSDPKQTRIFKQANPRNWSGTWSLVPQSQLESAAIAGILGFLKYAAAPKKYDYKDKVGLLKQPYIWKIIFVNPVLQLAMRFNEMSLNTYSINYFPDGYASTYWDFFPKHIELTMSFTEFQFKTKQDWAGF